MDLQKMPVTNVRLECLKLASERYKGNPNITCEMVLDLAEKYVVFCEQDKKQDNSNVNPAPPRGRPPR